MRQLHRLALSTLAGALLAGAALAADAPDATSSAAADEADATIDLTGRAYRIQEPRGIWEQFQPLGRVPVGRGVCERCLRQHGIKAQYCHLS